MKYLKNITSLRLYQDRCTGCRRCIEVCPHAVFGFKDKKAFITDADLCMECGACSLNCEYDAIYVDAGVGCAAAVIHSMIYGGEPNCDCSDSSDKNCC